MKSSSVHSFNFIGDSDTKIFIRLAWLGTFVLSMTACTFMVVETYMEINSITMVTEDKGRPISEIPFPAVTIFGSYPSTYIFSRFSEDAIKYEFHHVTIIDYTNFTMSFQFYR